MPRIRGVPLCLGELPRQAVDRATEDPERTEVFDLDPIAEPLASEGFGGSAFRVFVCPEGMANDDDPVTVFLRALVAEQTAELDVRSIAKTPERFLDGRRTTFVLCQATPGIDEIGMPRRVEIWRCPGRGQARHVECEPPVEQSVIGEVVEIAEAAIAGGIALVGVTGTRQVVRPGPLLRDRPWPADVGLSQELPEAGGCRQLPAISGTILELVGEEGLPDRLTSPAE